MTPSEEAVKLLMREGFDEADIIAAYDSLIAAGLEKPNAANAVPQNELEILRDQLRADPELTDSEITFPVDSSHPAVVAFGEALQVVVDDNLRHLPEDVRCEFGWTLAAEVICYPAGRVSLAALAAAVANATADERPPE